MDHRKQDLVLPPNQDLSHSPDRITRREAHVPIEENIDQEVETMTKNVVTRVCMLII